MKRLQYLLDSDHKWSGLKLASEPIFAVVVPFNDGYGAPAVSTNAASDIAKRSATLNGEITAIGGGNADERGFDYVLYGGSWAEGSSWTESGSFGVASFNHALTGLSPNTIYQFRAKAHNSVGWGYGGPESFTTLPSRARHHPTIPTEPNRGKVLSEMGSLE